VPLRGRNYAAKVSIDNFQRACKCRLAQSVGIHPKEKGLVSP